MTYDPAIPTDLPAPADIVSQIKYNFSQFATVFSNNHTALNNSNQGKHEGVIFKNQLTDPPIVNKSVFTYAKSVVSNTDTSSQMFFKVPKFLPNTIPWTATQFTFNHVNTAGPVYQTFLPGGYILYFGQVGEGVTTLSPRPTKILSVIANIQSQVLGLQLYNVSINANNYQFTITNNLPSGAQYTWFAIGSQ